MNSVNITNESIGESPIQQFYNDATIFVTGATGFMGKVLLEKLLRTCQNLRTIYVLVREKRGKTTDTRIEELFEDELFSKLKLRGSKLQHKVIPMSGDISMAGLGLRLEDIQTLQNEVNVVFHVAATVKFDEKLKMAVAINLNGTREILEICRNMNKLKSLIHVSTAYSNCHQENEIDECFYEYPISFQELPYALEKLDDRSIDEITPKILGKWPNTYTFTKAMAESLVQQSGKGLPIGVFRPGIVTSIYKEPLEGWIDNIYGPTGICAGALMGVLNSLHCNENILANIVPVDMTINALITSAWDVAEKNKIKALESPPIYNYVSTVDGQLTWGEYCNINIMYGRKYPLLSSIWYLNFGTTKNIFLHKFYMIFLHLIPALFVDALCIPFGKQPRLTKIYKQTSKFTNIIGYFTINEWGFKNKRIHELWLNLDKTDQMLFPFNVKDIKWLEYFRTYVLGMRRYLCKEDLTTLSAARNKQNMMYIASTVLKYVVIYTLFCSVYNISKAIVNFIGF